MNDLKIIEEAVRLSRENASFALVIVTESKGSTPRKAGAKMIVKSDGSICGTVGGGKAERDIMDTAMAAISHGRPSTWILPLVEEHGHVCGGSLQVYIEPCVLPPHLVIFGAGHVGRALASVARLAGFRVTASDERPEYATKEKMPDAHEMLTGVSEHVLSTVNIGPGTFIVIATHSYESDVAAACATLKTQARYIGIIGSKRKKEVLFKDLMLAGISQEDLARLRIPVGLPIGGDSPGEIAVSIVAQLVQERSKLGG